ncbi:MAG: hypothetical protein V4510_07415 [bacterium]
MHPLRALAPLLAILLAPAASAAFVSEVAGGDTDNGIALVLQHAAFTFIDGNANGHLDSAAPREPIYLDLDASGTVTYGDERLTPFGHYAGHTQVDLTDADAGRALAAAPGWFARSNAGWVADLDNSGTLTAGDLRLGADGATPIATAQATGEILRVQGTPGTLFHMGQGASLYLDTDSWTAGGGQVSPGDVRIIAGPFATEPVAPQPPASPVPAQDSTPAATAHQAADSWRSLDWVLVGLAVANLAGLAMLAKAQRPKNPFK